MNHAAIKIRLIRDWTFSWRVLKASDDFGLFSKLLFSDDCPLISLRFVVSAWKR